MYTCARLAGVSSVLVRVAKKKEKESDVGIEGVVWAASSTCVVMVMVW